MLLQRLLQSARDFVSTARRTTASKCVTWLKWLAAHTMPPSEAACRPSRRTSCLGPLRQQLCPRTFANARLLRRYKLVRVRSRGPCVWFVGRRLASSRIPRRDPRQCHPRDCCWKSRARSARWALQSGGAYSTAAVALAKRRLGFGRRTNSVLYREASRTRSAHMPAENRSGLE